VITTIGRGRRSTLRIDDESVSGNHARLETRGERFWICDASSTNGTYLNGRRVGEAQLSEGDTVRFGDVDFIFDGAQLVRASQRLSMKSELDPETNRSRPNSRLTLTKASIVAVIVAASLVALLLVLRSNRNNTLDLARATVLVVVLDGDDELCGFGSGFLVRDGQTVATNHHVIASVIENVPGELDCKKLVIGVSDESGLRVDRFLAAQVLRSDARTDVALLELLELEDQKISPIQIARGEPRLGDAIRIFGYPGIGGVSLTVTDGFLGGIDESESVPLYKTASQIAGGNSGGPVVDKDGRVIGIAAATYADAEEVEAIGLIVPVRHLVELLARG
jgi:S1-C subfamily serine protease